MTAILRKNTLARCVLGRDDYWGFMLLEKASGPARLASNEWPGQGNFALNYVQSGEGTAEIGQREHILRPGTVYQRLPDGAAGRLRWTSREATEWYVILDHRLYTRLRPLGVFASRRVYHLRQPALLEEIFLEAGARLGPLSPRVTEAVNRPATAECVRLLSEIATLLEQSLASAHDPVGDLIRRARLKLEGEGADETPLPEVARQLGVGYSHLRKVFRERMGESLNAYRLSQRMHRARELLMTHTVQETAAELGYSDAFAFSSRFKKATGESPSAFRHRLGL
jgi:AraC-like DNA-binding protein